MDDYWKVMQSFENLENSTSQNGERIRIGHQSFLSQLDRFSFPLDVAEPV